jgi:TP901 family phage tail tape measure protein
MSGTAAEMRASLLLTLEDELSGGLSRLMETLDRLNGVVARLTDTFAHLQIGRAFEHATQPINQAAAAMTRAGEDAVRLRGAVGGVAGELTRVSDAAAHLGVATAFDGARARIHEAATEIGWFERQMNALQERAVSVGQHLAPQMTALRAFTNQAGIVGGAIAGASVIAPAERYADYENILRHIAITEGLSGAAADQEVTRLTRLFADDAARTGQASESIAKAYSELVQIGIPAAILDRVIGAHSQAATAYNISPEALGPAVGALLQNLKIPEGEIGAALAAMALASKEGRFKVEDFSLELPGIAGAVAGAGGHGRAAADEVFAAMETIMRNAGQPSTAAADFRQAISYIFSPFAERFFLHQGIDLDARILEAGRHGIGPLQALLDLLREITRGMNPEEARLKLGTVMHNQEAANAISALLQHYDEYKALQARLDKVDPALFERDYATALQAPITQVRLFHENLAQATRALGEGFTPAMSVFTHGVGLAADLLKGANDNFPILTRAAYGAAAALAALAAAAGAKSLVGDYVAAGGSLLVRGLGGAASASAMAVGLLAAEFGAFLGRQREEAFLHPPKDLPPPPIRLEITADPDLRVRRLGTDGGNIPLLHVPLGHDPSTLVVGRD